MSDVAIRAGVSPSTVSLFLRRPEAVAPATGQAIEAAIRALDYVPNLMAGGLAAARSRTVGVVVPSIRNAFFAETVAALQREFDRARLTMLLGPTDYDPAQEERFVRSALAWAPAAMVLTGLSHGGATRSLLQAGDVPVVEIWEIGATPPIDMAVGFRHDRAGAAAARHLIARGRRELVFFGARTHEDARALQRAEGFLATAAEAGLPARRLFHAAPASAELGGILLSQLLDAGPCPPGLGLGCSNDLIALGVLFEAERRGIAIPADLAVVGFGDLDFAAVCNPALSTVRPSGEAIGTETARLILDRLARPDAPRAAVIDTGFSVAQRQSS